MKKICIVTGTRAEYGLLYPLIKKMIKDDFFDVKIVATGSHLSPMFGNTIRQIEEDGFRVHKKIDIILSSDTPSSVSKSMGLAMISLGEYFEEVCPDMIIVLGDRYEILAVVSTAVVANIPVAHLHGGEITQGAYDELFRHAITKMSTLHFTSCETYRKRVIQMGEQPCNVFNVGAIGIDNIKELQLMDKKELEQSIGFKLGNNYGLVTFHPVTMEKADMIKQFEVLLEALDEISDMKFIITKANADDGGKQINQMIDEYARSNVKKVMAVTSLGQLRYLSAMQYCSCIIGNSSSGILEAPTFKVPTVNIGNRQKGRIMAKSIINVEPTKEDIIDAIRQSLQDEFRESIRHIKSPYGNGNASEKIVEHIKNYFQSDKISLVKPFYDMK